MPTSSLRLELREIGPRVVVARLADPRRGPRPGPCTGRHRKGSCRGRRAPGTWNSPLSRSMHRRAHGHDHPTPYVPPARGGPPAQTGDHADAPLTRTHHRVKTHAPGYDLRQLELGAYRWTTPHGLARVVTPSGTTPQGCSSRGGPDCRGLGRIASWCEGPRAVRRLGAGLPPRPATCRIWTTSDRTQVMYPAIGGYNHVSAPAAGGACTGSVCRPAASRRAAS